MLIADNFVMLNFPKTGSSFAREAIRQMYEARETQLMRLARRLGLRAGRVTEIHSPKIHVQYSHGTPDQHGTVQQIPVKHRQKAIVSVTRNPFLRLVSRYHFGWWKKYPPGPLEEISGAFPNFPELSFEEFYAMSHKFERKSRLGDIQTKIDVGVHSIAFIQFYFRDPVQVLRQLDSDYIESKRYRGDMAPITFLHQENLRTELKQFLVNTGAGEAEVRFIDTMPAVNESTSRSTNSSSKATIPQCIREQILHREQLLFAIFPEYLSPVELSSKVER